MKLLFKYLKKHLLSCFVIIGVLFGLAMCDLALPEYMAKIINNGITYSGITEDISKNMIESDYQTLKILLPDEVTSNFDSHFTKIESANATAKEKKKYPSLESHNVYLLKTKFTSEETNKIVKVEAYLGMTLSTGTYSEILNLDAATIAGYKVTIQSDTIPQLRTYGKVLSVSFIKNSYINLGLKIINIQNSYIVNTGGIMLLIAIIGICFQLTNGFFASRMAANIGYEMRRDVFIKVESFSNKELDEFSTASLITRTTNDIQQIQQLIAMSTRMLIYSPILAIGGILKIINSNSTLTWIIGMGIGALISVIIIIFAIGMPKFTKIQKILDRLNLVIRELLTGQLVVRAFNTQLYQEQKFDNENKVYTKTNLFVNRLMSFMGPIMTLILNGVTILIFWFGAKQIDTGKILVGDIMSFMQYGMQIIMSFLMISMLAIILPRASISIKRISEVLNVNESIKNKDNPIEFDGTKKGLLEFKNVSFKYPHAEKEVLSNISFTAKPGEFTAIIGSTGSGKSTIVNLIPRFYDVTDGQILLDGLDIRDVKLHELRKRIGYISQKAVLFSGTIENTIKYGNQDASEEEVLKALKISQAYDFVTSKEEGLATAVAQGGSNFSGGQKQRLSIARALAKKSEIYLFDDTFSALDYKTDAMLRQALNEDIKKTKSSILLIAQRISSILHADKIIVLDHGKIVGTGTHKELLKSCTIYQEIASSQLSKEELEHE